MTGLREMKDREYVPHRAYLQVMTRGLLSLSKVLLFNLDAFRKMRHHTQGSAHYVRPPRRYELPVYRSGMRVCLSDEKYLRPTRYCNPRAPDIVAMAHHLGAYQVSDREFAEAAFEFVKRKVTLEILPMDGVEHTLRRGTGTCLHEISLLVALCRAAGIRARYKLYAPTMIQAWNDAILVDPLLQKWYNTLGFFMMHGEGEVLIDGEWVVVDVGPTPERQAAAGIPITGFGEDSLGVWLSAQPGSIMHVESLPYGMDFLLKLAARVTPATLDRVNASIQQQIERGRHILEAVGEAAYDRQAREHKERMSPEPTVALQAPKEIIFEI